MPPLTLMLKPASGACTMRCRYCFYADEIAHRSAQICPRMSDATLEKVIRRAVLTAEDHVMLIFQGGEPTLAGKAFFRKLLTLEKAYRRDNLRFDHAFQTNGLMLDEEWCAIFREGEFLLGVSLDGMQMLHDRNRPDAAGQGTWARVTENLALLRREKIPYNILCVVTDEMTPYAREVFAELKRHAFLQFIPCLDALDGSDAPPLHAENYGRFLIDLFDCYEQAQHTGKPVSIRLFDSYLAMLAGYPPDSCALSGRCGLYCVIEADGSVYPCDFYALDEWKMGNINECNFPRLLTSETAKRFLTPLDTADECRTCPHWALCRGGCRREREGSPDGKNRWCAGLKLFFSKRGERLRALSRRVYQQ